MITTSNNALFFSQAFLWLSSCAAAVWSLVGGHDFSLLCSRRLAKHQTTTVFVWSFLPSPELLCHSVYTQLRALLAERAVRKKKQYYNNSIVRARVRFKLLTCKLLYLAT